MKINENIFELRKKKGISQEELGAKLGVSRQTVSKWEVGKSVPDIQKLKAIADLFGITVDELIKEKSSATNLDETSTTESTNKEDNNQDKNYLKNNSIRKIVIKSIICILIVAFIIFSSFLLYRVLVINALYEKVVSITDVDNIKNVRLQVDKMKIGNYQLKVPSENIQYLYKDGILKIIYYNFNFGSSDIAKIEYRDKEKHYYIDYNNKTYTVKNIEQEPHSDTWNSPALIIQSEVLGEYKLDGIINKVLTAFNFKNKIEIDRRILSYN